MKEMKCLDCITENYEECCGAGIEKMFGIDRNPDSDYWFTDEGREELRVNGDSIKYNNLPEDVRYSYVQTSTRKQIRASKTPLKLF